MADYIMSVDEVVRRFGDVVAVDNVSLKIKEGELVTLLGPSGCGKTTLLRMIAGFETPTSGRIRIANQDMHHVPPHLRPVNMVFQKYALFPHLNVFENIAFGLRLRRLSEDEIARRVAAMLRLVGLEGFEKRWPSELSGGEAQRIALARALIMDPKVLLLDEPLGALDLKIRKQMQLELKRIHIELGATFLYVTHDQEEAMTISDRIVIMSGGRIIQVGTPEEIYTNPNCTFCASFVGESNILRGRIVEVGTDFAGIDLGVGVVKARARSTLNKDQEISVLMRPEVFTLGDPGTAESEHNVLQGRVIDTVFMGSSVYYRIDVGVGIPLLVEEPAREGQRVFRRDDVVTIIWSGHDSLILED